jgi:hypothetical protein
MPKVLNARQAGTKPAADRVYVGRPSKWASVCDRPRRCCPKLSSMAPAVSAIAPTAGMVLRCGK